MKNTVQRNKDVEYIKVKIKRHGDRMKSVTCGKEVLFRRQR